MSGIRVIIAKPGLDGHDRGAKVVARALRDAGFEVIYTGLHQTPEQIVAAAVQEDADAIGLSVLSGAHMTQFSRVLELLKERDAADIVVFGGGIIPDADIAELERMGVARLFTPGATTTEIVDWARSALGSSEPVSYVGHPRQPGAGQRARLHPGGPAPEIRPGSFPTKSMRACARGRARWTDRVDLFEYQAKELFAEYGVPIPQGKVATTPEEARQIAAEFAAQRPAPSRWW